METYQEPKYVVRNRYKQNEILYKTTSLETAEKVAEILSKHFPDESAGNSFFVFLSTFNSDLAEKAFEDEIVKSYKDLGVVYICPKEKPKKTKKSAWKNRVLHKAFDKIEHLQERVEKVEDNREHIERLLCNAEKRVQELEEQQRWIPVSEPPEQTGEYWVSFEYDGEILQGYCEYYQSIDSWDNTEPITHWRLLPLPPKEE